MAKILSIVSIPERVWVWLRLYPDRIVESRPFVSIPERVWVWLRPATASPICTANPAVSIPERVWVWLRPPVPSLVVLRLRPFQSLRGFGFG